jgi:N-dimethylarginine dimethylaminohydrolase
MDEPDESPSTFGAAAYGGGGWSQRTRSSRDEIGHLWAGCGINSEWGPLRSVLLHRPGKELLASHDPDAVQMLGNLDLGRAQAEHDQITEVYRTHGVTVHDLEPHEPATPNQMFCADLLFMTPEGAILSRPASTVRAGEERQVAHRLAALGIPIVRTMRGTATTEGADAAWLDEETVLVGRGLRTNQEAIDQLMWTLGEMGVSVIAVDMPFGTMHLMGMLRIVDRDLAIAWPRRTPHAAVKALRERGYEVAFITSEDEATDNRSLNFVTLGPRKVLTVADNPITQRFYEKLGIDCVTAPAAELGKAAGAIGCLTGILWRESV